MAKVRNAFRKADEYVTNALIGTGYGIQNQLEGMYQMAANPRETVAGFRNLLADPKQIPGVVRNALVDSYSRATSGPLGFGEVLGENLSPGMFRRGPNKLDATVYHGSPHRINNVTPDAPMGRFDMSKVGTGEGAQAYGHGVYLAEKPGTARTYMTAGVDKYDLAANMDKTAEAFYEALEPMSDGSVFAGQLRSKMSRDQFVSAFKEGRITAHEFPASIRNAVEKKLMPPGHFYTVDLPDEHIAKMLDWDAPLSQQPEAVRKALKSYAVADDASITGGEFYRKLTQEMGAEPEEISAALRAAGIPGIRYLDGNSRTTSFGPRDSGTRNFVIFDGDTAKILNRE
jgi:hypothetical protein